MIPDHEFAASSDSKRQYNCDMCNLPTVLFNPAQCTFIPICKQRPKIIYLTKYVCVLCSDRCLKEWSDKNMHFFESECKKPIIEDSKHSEDDFDDDDDDDFDEDDII